MPIYHTCSVWELISDKNFYTIHVQRKTRKLFIRNSFIMETKMVLKVCVSVCAGAGVFFLSCAEGEQISFLFDCIVRGISPTRAPFGIKPPLPGVFVCVCVHLKRLLTTG